ncbi:MAG: DUF5343 domain-containing protein [Chloroflexi bacterium]|nr:DUF5343 domain-containing protein [Chloroflexota bacterium]
MTLQEQTPTIPPYVPYRTFQTFLEFLLDEGIPERVDKTVWGPRFSGSSGTQLMTALKVLLLVDSEGHPSEELEELVHAEGDDRRALLRRILERFYTPVFELDLPRASRGQFHEAFRSFGTKEGVLTKCEAFFIRAAQAAGIELSRRILTGRHGANRTRTSPAPARARSAVNQAVAPEKKIAPMQAESVIPAQAAKLELADRILAKYPDFDPSWDPSVQARWLEGMTRLYEGLSVGPADRPADIDHATEEDRGESKT